MCKPNFLEVLYKLLVWQDKPRLKSSIKLIDKGSIDNGEKYELKLEI